jgi:hypothetical protein
MLYILLLAYSLSGVEGEHPFPGTVEAGDFEATSALSADVEIAL